MSDYEWIKDLKQGDIVYHCQGSSALPESTTVARITKLYLFLANGSKIRLRDGQQPSSNPYMCSYIVPVGSSLALKADRRDLYIKMEKWLKRRSLDELLEAASKLGIH